MKINGTGEMRNYAAKEAPWYEYRTNITEVQVGEGVTTIGKRAFYYLSKLKKVEFAENSKVTIIESYAFSHCSSLTEMILPDKAEKILTRGFEYCTALSDVYIPDGMSSIQKEAFYQDKNVVLNVAEGSYAQTYAEAVGINYSTR